MSPVRLPVVILRDANAKLSGTLLRRFDNSLWPEAAWMYSRAGVWFEVRRGEARMDRPPYREPAITGLQARRINLLLTSRAPHAWDGGRGWSGVSLLYRGRVLCLVALEHANGNLIPWLSLNTVAHELMHAISGDVFAPQPGGFRVVRREAAVDSALTRLWLFGSEPGVRGDAMRLLGRLELQR